MRIFGVALLAASLFMTSLSGTGAMGEPLKPGYPSGVHAARRASLSTPVMIGVGAAILAGVGIAASGQSSVVNSLVIPGAVAVVNPPTNVTVSTSTTS